MKNSEASYHIYQRIADNIERQIFNESLGLGDKLPSVRVMRKDYGVSVSTVLQAYYLLESKGLIEARPQSGYYVRYSGKNFLKEPSKSQPGLMPGSNTAEKMIAEVYRNLTASDIVHFSLGVPSPDLLPVSKLNKCMIEALRRLPASGTNYETVQGSLNLRRQIAKRSMIWGGQLSPNEIVTTTGCMDALALSLMAATNRGDTIAVESPCYFNVLQLADNIGLKIIELPTDSKMGIDIDILKKTLQQHKINALLLMANFSNPLGNSIPDENKKAIVRLMEQYNVPLIEDDIYGDIYFSQNRPKSCKSFDESGLVLWCSSFSKTLAPGYRVGWVAPGKYLNKIKQLKMYHEVSSATLQQEAIAVFLENGRYDYHLRKLRNTLFSNSMQYMRAISNYFPPETRVSHSQGGLFLWIELEKHIDTYHIYKVALNEGISIAPGRMFTLKDQFQNCMRLSYGMSWNDKIEEALKRLGELVFLLK